MDIFFQPVSQAALAALNYFRFQESGLILFICLLGRQIEKKENLGLIPLHKRTFKIC
jgi:hypothetical protein